MELISIKDAKVNCSVEGAGNRDSSEFKLTVTTNFSYNFSLRIIMYFGGAPEIYFTSLAPCCLVELDVVLEKGHSKSIVFETQKCSKCSKCYPIWIDGLYLAQFSKDHLNWAVEQHFTAFDAIIMEENMAFFIDKAHSFMEDKMLFHSDPVSVINDKALQAIKSQAAL